LIVPIATFLVLLAVMHDGKPPKPKPPELHKVVYIYQHIEEDLPIPVVYEDSTVVTWEP